MQILNPVRAITAPALIAAAAAFGTTSTASASIYELTFSGTYDVETGFGPDLFGEPGPTAAFQYSITIDTDLDTNTEAYLTGDAIGSNQAGDDFYGYSASSIIASSITFGNKTFDASDLDGTVLGPGVSADFWLNTDLSTGATPTGFWLRFDGGPGIDLFLGNGFVNQRVLSFRSSSQISDFLNFAEGFTPDTALSMQLIPTPGTLGAAAAGLILVGARRRRA